MIKDASSRLWQTHERLRFPLPSRRSGLETEELLKAACIMLARRKRWTLLSYLLLFPVLLSTFCSSREYSDPDEKTLILLLKPSSFFPAVLGKRANFAFMDHQKREHNAHCALSMYQRFAPSSATSKRMPACLKLGTVLALTLLKVALMSTCRPRPFLLFPTIECKSYSS